MERKIGEVFKCGNNSVITVESSKGAYRCPDCDLWKVACEKLEKETGECDDLGRQDGKNVIFRKVKK